MTPPTPTAQAEALAKRIIPDEFVQGDSRLAVMLLVIRRDLARLIEEVAQAVRQQALEEAAQVATAIPYKSTSSDPEDHAVCDGWNTACQSIAAALRRLGAEG